MERDIEIKLIGFIKVEEDICLFRRIFDDKFVPEIKRDRHAENRYPERRKGSL